MFAAMGSFTIAAIGADSPMTKKGSEFVSVKAAEIKWSDAPSVAPGAKIAVLEGDLKSSGPLTFRVKLPPNTKIGVHTHPLDERVTVLSGTFYFATGDKFDTGKAKAYKAGDALIIPTGTPMYGYTKNNQTVFQVHGTGPWGISFLEGSDASKKKK
ncbi:MAG: cupin domain-containing protein [Deltaproteobacteria bacterium]|nr:cupin domain-containing protein [Deltaproteobacteria bacterium]